MVANRLSQHPLERALFVEIDASHLTIGGFDQDDRIAGIPKGTPGDETEIFNQANNADDRRGINVFAERFIIKADVPTGDRSLKNVAGFRHTFDDFAELPHHFRMLGIAKVQTIRGGKRLSARANNIAYASAYREALYRLFAASFGVMRVCHGPSSLPSPMALVVHA